MRKITQEEFKLLSFKDHKRPANPATETLKEAIKELEINEIIFITKTEWPLKSQPGGICNNFFRGERRFVTNTLKDESGWAIRRTQ